MPVTPADCSFPGNCLASPLIVHYKISPRFDCVAEHAHLFYPTNPCIGETQYSVSKMDPGKTIGVALRDSQPAHRQPAREADLRDLGLGDEIARIGLPDLIVPTKSPKRVIVDLAILNRMYLSSLQEQIMREVRLIDRDLHFDRDRSTSVGRLLDEYC